MPAEPIIVEVKRGKSVESRHRVHVCVSDLEGNLLIRHGDETLPVFPRSAIKPIQAIPLVESGAADAFDLSPFQLSLACASHNGARLHADAVQAWLADLGLTESAMVCAGHWSINQSALIDQVTAGVVPSQRHNNCSGKHCGLLTLARHLGVPLEGYERPDHPVQQRLLGVLEAMTATRLDMASAGTDGCGIPTIPVPLGHLALGYANWADPSEQPVARREAIDSISQAIWDHPMAMAGEGRLCSVLNALRRTDGVDLLVKTGAEGVYCAALPGLGLGVALKAEDGATRASEGALMAVLDRMGLFDLVRPETRQSIDRLRHPTVTSWDGTPVGAINAVF